jgi:hypothetical protein
MAKVGDEIVIIEMTGEPQYTDICGQVEHIDDAGQLHGTWGGCALIEGEDNFIVIEEELRYLEMLRQSGATNMYGATPYLQREFGIDRERAKTILVYWMDNYKRLCEKYKWR